ncbi:hypothetical protein EUGRSUZ_G00550 [Eucalyptus grandis]|uniref:AAA+ ATPase domain-containing protein n=2 Tax=Eucalyptus grandis TaxID=71139 RepID=A0A059BAC2_EUCGR|nr:hypothetical protein EUGRSUZ_G00550 [Eucalyptus grandis]
MAEVVLGAVSIVSGCLVAPVNRLCGYVISYEGDVRKLKAKVAELGNARQNVQDSIKDAQNNVKPIKAHVNKWMEDVEKDTKEAHRVLDDEERTKKTCFYRWLPNVRNRLGREARRKAEDIQGLIDRKPFGEVYDDPPPGLVDGTSDVISSAGDRGDTTFDSRASILEDIMNALYDEEHKVIGVYGPGGVGKTTLLEEVNKKLRKEGRPFNMIVKAKVSQTPDLNDIQYQIADDLNLNLKDKQSQQGRRDLLFQRLQKDPNEKVLIILDDLWKEFDLKEVGIPSGDESRGCKLLLTSRFKNVLEQMKCDTPIFHLEGLKNDEAFRLFEKMVGDRLKDNEQLKTIADQVVKKLAGLPLLIISVASFLKEKDECAWRNAQIEIDESNKEKKETIVKLSYNHLKSEDAKTLFLLCGLIGGTIQVETLLVLGMGLGLFGEFRRTMQDSRDRLNTILDELRSACLLLDGGDDKNDVTIHDLYSEVVVSTPFRGQDSLIMNSNYGSWSKEKLEKCWAICLADVDQKRLDELMKCRSLPDLKILMLSQPEGWRWKQVHEREVGDCSGLLDFTYMEELPVLYFCSMHIARFPRSIKILKNLHSLYLDHCNVDDVAILGELEALQILSLVGCALSRLPKEIRNLTSLRSLNLSNCKELWTIEPGVLECLINLEELYLRGSFDRWMGKDGIPSKSRNAKLAELKSLTKIVSLEISIRDPSVLLEDDDFPFGNLIKFWINIGDGKGIGGWRTIERKLEGLNTLELNLEEWDIFFSKEWVQKILQKTQCLYLDGLKKFKKNAPELCTEGFRELKYLDSNESPSIEYLANSSNGLPLTAFTILESLFLKNLINLEKICNSLVTPKCFSILKVVNIHQCHRLENLWFLSEMQRLVHLEVLQVRECDSMRAIITDGAGEIEVLAYDTVELPNLRRLKLCELPKMTSFRTSADGAPIQVSLPRLESLVMVGFLGLEEILSSESSLKYNNLKLLHIEGSKSTSSIPKDWILKLPNLESVEIVSCRSTEVVFDLEELKVTGNAEILSRLTELTLFLLPKLQCMCKKDVQLQGISIFRNLEKLYINNTGLSFLFPVFVAKCLREIREIKVMDCPNMMAMIVDEGGRGDGIDDIIKFPLLKRLFMRGCPRVKFFSYPHGKKKSVTTSSDSQDANSDSFFVQKVSLPSLDTLDINGCFEMRESLKWIWHSELPRSSICELATVRIRNCLKLLNVFPSTIIGKLQNLKEVVIEKCDFLESLFDCGSFDANIEQPTVSLPKLERMKIKDASELRCIVKADSQMILGFPSLKEVYVNNCQKLRYLFPNFTATTLEKLERISIDRCDQMKEVVLEKGGGQSKADVMSFPSLRDLSIWNCLNLGAFIRSPTSAKRLLGETAEENNEWSQPFFNEMVTFPNIRSICFGGLQCKELWDNQIPANSFSILKSLGLRNCNNLQHVAPSNIWKRLQLCLEDLKVVSCHSIKIIYEGDGMDTKGGELRWLYLRDLENLMHIWQSDGLPNIMFPNLREIEVVGCSRLETLFPTFTAKFLGQIEELVVNSCEKMELIAEHEKGEEGICTTITFSKLTLLGLFKLPKFRSFLPEKYSLKFPCSEDLEHFPSLKVWSIESCGAEPNQVNVDWEQHYRERLWRKLPRDQYPREQWWRI